MIHAKCSPSNSHIWMNCPGSIKLSDKMEQVCGPEESSDAAKEGTYIHEQAAKRLIEFFGKDNVHMETEADG